MKSSTQLMVVFAACMSAVGLEIKASQDFDTVYTRVELFGAKIDQLNKLNTPVAQDRLDLMAKELNALQEAVNGFATSYRQESLVTLIAVVTKKFENLAAKNTLQFLTTFLVEPQNSGTMFSLDALYDAKNFLDAMDRKAVADSLSTSYAPLYSQLGAARMRYTTLFLNAYNKALDKAERTVTKRIQQLADASARSSFNLLKSMQFLPQSNNARSTQASAVNQKKSGFFDSLFTAKKENPALTEAERNANARATVMKTFKNMQSIGTMVDELGAIKKEITLLAAIQPVSLAPIYKKSLIPVELQLSASRPPVVPAPQSSQKDTEDVLEKVQELGTQASQKVDQAAQAVKEAATQAGASAALKAEEVKNRVFGWFSSAAAPRQTAPTFAKQPAPNQPSAQQVIAVAQARNKAVQVTATTKTQKIIPVAADTVYYEMQPELVPLYKKVQQRASVVNQLLMNYARALESYCTLANASVKGKAEELVFASSTATFFLDPLLRAIESTAACISREWGVNSNYASVYAIMRANAKVTAPNIPIVQDPLTAIQELAQLSAVQSTITTYQDAYAYLRSLDMFFMWRIGSNGEKESASVTPMWQTSQSKAVAHLDALTAQAIQALTSKVQERVTRIQERTGKMLFVTLDIQPAKAYSDVAKIPFILSMHDLFVMQDRLARYAEQLRSIAPAQTPQTNKAINDLMAAMELWVAGFKGYRAAVAEQATKTMPDDQSRLWQARLGATDVMLKRLQELWNFIKQVRA